MRLKNFFSGNNKIKDIGIFSWSIIGLLLIIALLFYIIYLIRLAIIPLIIAVIVAYLLTPIVALLQKKMRRIFAVAIAYIFFIGIIFVMFFFIIPVIIDQSRTFIDKFPMYMDNLSRIINDFLNKSPLIVSVENIIGKEIAPIDASGITQFLIGRINLEEIDIFQRATDFGKLLINVVLYLIVGPLLGIYILNSGDRMRDIFLKAFPRKYKIQANIMLDRINKVIGKYIRARILISVFVGILSTAVLLILKVDLAMLLGFIAGLFNMIPLIGPIIGAIPAALAALFISPLKALLVILFFVAIQLLDGYLISPNILKYQIVVHPGIIIFSLMVGGVLLGFWGFLIAVPAAAVLQEILKYYLFEKNKTAS